MLTTNPYLTAAVPDAIPAPSDIQIGLVNRILYAGPPALKSKREQDTASHADPSKKQSEVKKNE